MTADGHYRAVLSGVGLDKPTKITEHDPTRIYWGDMLFKKGQIGRITILKPINLWTDDNGKLKEVRVLSVGDCYRVYGYRDKYGGQYDVGANNWITKMDGYITYETPSKAFLEKFKEF